MYKRQFYGCTNYRSDDPCDFRVWQKPIGEACPKCGTEFLIPKGGKKNPKLECVNETCDFERVYDQDELRDREESRDSASAADSATG